MSKEIVLIFTSYKEANSLLHQSKVAFQKIKPDYFLGKYNKILIRVYICGIGEKNVNIFLNNCEMEACSLVIKAGTSAIINPDLPLLEPFIPQIICCENRIINLNEIKDFDKIKNLLGDKIINKKLLTIKLPLINEEKAKEIFNNGYDFVDMESFYIIDKFKEKLVLPILIGTDRGDCNAKKDFLINISKAAEILKDFIFFVLKKINF